MIDTARSDAATTSATTIQPAAAMTISAPTTTTISVHALVLQPWAVANAAAVVMTTQTANATPAVAAVLVTS